MRKNICVLAGALCCSIRYAPASASRADFIGPLPVNNPNRYIWSTNPSWLFETVGDSLLKWVILSESGQKYQHFSLPTGRTNYIESDISIKVP
jgi:hypothetical protein